MDESGIVNLLVRSIGSGLRPIGDGDYKAEDGLWHCGKCHEAMQTRLDGNAMHLPELDGRIVRTQCRCEREAYKMKEEQRKAAEESQYIEALKRKSMIDSRYSDCCFASFVRNADNEKNLSLCKRYVERFTEMQQKNQGLLFYGKSGTGKTYMSACIANELICKKVAVVMTSFVKIISEIQANMGQEESIIARLNRAELLVIDDLGAERSSEYAIEKAYNVIDSRYRAKKPMIISTNLTLSEMQAQTDIRYARIYDRILECCYPVRFTGKTWRYVEAERRFDEMKALLEG